MTQLMVWYGCPLLRAINFILKVLILLLKLGKSWILSLKNEIQAYQLENELLTLVPSSFSSIEDFLYFLKTLRLILECCKVKKEDDSLIYGILSKLGPIYSLFLSTFHSTREALIYAWTKYKAPSFDALYDSLIREQENILHLDLIKSISTSNKAWVAQQYQYSKNPKKHHRKRIVLNQTTRILNMIK